MSEHLMLNLGGNEFESRPDNTTLFTFMGKTALNGIEYDNSRVNHIFFQTGNEDDQTMSGTYIFRTEANAGIFDTILSHITTNDYPMVLNRRDVPQCDWDAFQRMIDQQAASEEIPDTLPEGWE